MSFSEFVVLHLLHKLLLVLYSLLLLLILDETCSSIHPLHRFTLLTCLFFSHAELFSAGWTTNRAKVVVVHPFLLFV